MNIVVNAIPLLSYRTGVGQYLYNLCSGLNELDNNNHYTYFYGYFSEQLHDFSSSNKQELYKVKRKIRNIPVLGSLLSGMKGTLARINTTLNRNNSFDLYFEPNFIPLSEIKAKKTITTVHDLSFYLHPEWFPGKENKKFRHRFLQALPDIDHFITVSHYIKREMVEVLGLDESMISVVYNGYNDSIFKVYEPYSYKPTLKKYGIEDAYILFVGTLEPRKNIISLLRAYRELIPALRNEFKLVVAGGSGWLNSDIYDFVKQNHLENLVIFTGYVSDLEVAHLMNGATTFVYPSFYEGFGLPPLEAMACGAPVMVSNTTSMEELYKDSAYLIDPNNCETIVKGLEQILNDEITQQSFKYKGLMHSRHFSWKTAAKNTLEVFDLVASR